MATEKAKRRLVLLLELRAAAKQAAKDFAESQGFGFQADRKLQGLEDSKMLGFGQHNILVTF